MQLAEEREAKRGKRGGESKLGELIHKMNEEEIKPLKPGKSLLAGSDPQLLDTTTRDTRTQNGPY
eukprot:1586752-Rhodomonas_salina.6